MNLKKEMEHYLGQISTWEKSVRGITEAAPVPASFFSDSLDMLEQLKTDLYKMEALQLQYMPPANEFIEPGGKLAELIGEPVEQVGKSVEQVRELVEQVGESVAVNEPAETPCFLEHKLGKTICADLTKSLTINLRFMFLRDLFEGNEAEMNQTLTHLNTLPTLKEAMNYLNGARAVSWTSDSGAAFKELLEKHFA